MKRVVADTNVLVSALQFGGKPKQLLDRAVDGQIDLAISTEIVAETLRVLGQKFDRGSTRRRFATGRPSTMSSARHSGSQTSTAETWMHG